MNPFKINNKFIKAWATRDNTAFEDQIKNSFFSNNRAFQAEWIFAAQKYTSGLLSY